MDKGKPPVSEERLDWLQNLLLEKLQAKGGKLSPPPNLVSSLETLGLRLAPSFIRCQGSDRAVFLHYP